MEDLIAPEMAIIMRFRKPFSMADRSHLVPVLSAAKSRRSRQCCHYGLNKDANEGLDLLSSALHKGCISVARHEDAAIFTRINVRRVSRRERVLNVFHLA